MKKAATILIVSALVALAASSSITASPSYKQTCWQVKMTFVNYPTLASFAAWKIMQPKGHTLAQGEFSFKGDAGGFYQRVINRCLTSINPAHKVYASVRTTIYVYCGKKDCDAAIVIRRTK